MRRAASWIRPRTRLSASAYGHARRSGQITCLLGFVWVIPGSQALNAQERAALSEVADRAASLLWRQRIADRGADDKSAALLRELLESDASAVSARAAARLVLGQGWKRDHAAFAVAAVACAFEHELETIYRLRMRWSPADFVFSAGGERVSIVARTTAGHNARALLRALSWAGAERVACALVSDLTDAPEAWARALDALVVLEALPALGPAVVVDELGAWPAVHVCGRPPVGLTFRRRSIECWSTARARR